MPIGLHLVSPTRERLSDTHLNGETTLWHPAIDGFRSLIANFLYMEYVVLIGLEQISLAQVRTITASQRAA